MEKSIMYRLNLSMIFNKAWPRLACYHNESCYKKKGNYAKVPEIILTTPFLASGPLTIQLIHAIFTQKLRKETINKIWHTKIALHQVLFMSFLSGLSNYVWFNWIWLQQGMCKN